MTLYNDNDPKACAWMRELIRAGLIAEGTVDERSILEITPAELEGVRRYHAFAGIGGWDYALRLAGWPADREVWTASCPCQPFSDAGARRGVRDERNLWPAVLSLLAERRPATVFGEQVASRAGREWLARVRADLEGIGYAFGAADLCAASVGAPHIRQRLFWVADRDGERRPQRQERDGGPLEPGQHAPRGDDALGCGDLGGLEHAQGDGWEQGRAEPDGRSTTGGRRSGGLGHTLRDGSQGLVGAGTARGATLGARAPGGLPDADEGRRGARLGLDDAGEPDAARCGAGTLRIPEPASVVGVSGQHLAERRPQGRTPDRWDRPWSEYVVVPCGDGKARRLEPSISPLAHGVPARVGRLRGYGNAIVPFVAAVFVRAFLESFARKEA